METATTYSHRQVPNSQPNLLSEKRSDYCLVIPVFNEGERIRSVLGKIYDFQKTNHLVDVVILDKGSTDGSLDPDFLASVGVRGVLRLLDDGALSTQLRMGYAFALDEGYLGILTMDGNDKDDVTRIPDFISLLKEGYDFVQASRYLSGGAGVNTPLIRDIAVRFIHAPVISWLSGFSYTDTTQGYRGYSRRLLEDDRLAIFRDVFVTYELLAYISVKAPQLGFKVIETPVRRVYPKSKKTPTKISFFRGNFKLLQILFDLALKRYDPK